MTIGIDVRMVQNFPTGIGNYRENLIKALATLTCRDAINRVSTEFVLIGNAGNKMEAWAEHQPGFEFAVIKSKPNSLHQHFLLPFEIAKVGLDLFWTTPWGASVFLRRKYALTIYDLLYWRYPEIASPKARLYDLFVSKWVARRAEIIFTISEFVKDDIKEFLGVKRDKIINIRAAAGNAYQPPSNKDLQSLALKVLKKHQIAKPFFVYLGNFRPHKNLRTLLRALARMKNEDLPAGEAGSRIRDVKLVLIGDVDAKGRGQDSKNLLKLLEGLKLQNGVILAGRIEDDREVAAILNEAVALVHPSFHEGFGLTVLEAMSCGCLVIAANTTSIPEVVGEAGILVDPHKVDELVKTMETVLAGGRQELIEEGLEQAKKFSWQKTARKVLEEMTRLRVT